MAGTVVVDAVKSSTTGAPTFQNTSGTEIGQLCRAWVNFNGTGTVAIRASFNVSSITDNGTGNYTVNFTNSMPDTNYCVELSSEIGSGAGGYNGVYGTVATNSFSFVAYTNTGSTRDVSLAYVSIFR